MRQIEDCLNVVKIEDILDKGRLEECASLTWCSYWPLLEAPEVENRVALVTLSEEEPVALWLSVKTPLEDQPEEHSLLSLFVASPWRRRGVGRHLMQVAERELLARGICDVTTSYSSILPGADAMSGLLLNQNWIEPTADRIRICGRVGDTVTTSKAWDVLLRRLERRGLRYLSWREADIDVLERAGAMVDAGHTPEWADPRPWSDGLSRDLSLAILDGDGELTGWVVCEPQPKFNRCYFPIGWVTPSEQDRGSLVGAYLEGSRRIQSESGPSALAVLEASPRQGRAWQLFENHFSPSAQWSDRLLVSRKRLGKEATAAETRMVR